MSDRLLVSTRKGLFTVVRSGTGWDITRVDFLADNVTLALHDRRDGTTYVALDHGHFGVKVHRAKQGQAFEEIATPAYPPRPEGLVQNDMWGKPIPWSTQRIWALVAAGADEPGTIWCGTMPGGLFKSADHGATWHLLRGLWDHPKRAQWNGAGMDLPGLHSILIDPKTSQRVAIAVSTGGVWFTEDGGDSWQQRGAGMRADHVPPELTNDPNSQDVHHLAWCRAKPERMWVQHHNGIFVSDDEGQNFREITDVKPSVFGFAVAAHPTDPDIAWFVPEIKDEKRIPVDGKLVVTRTRDGGKSFEVLSDGLPQSHAYDVVYRHALTIDVSGNRLAFGSTTGGLWVTENQGDAWKCVTHTLPPVYAVTFA